MKFTIHINFSRGTPNNEFHDCNIKIYTSKILMYGRGFNGDGVQQIDFFDFICSRTKVHFCLDVKY